MALVVQANHGAGQGNANPSLYGLLNASANPFHPTPAGNNSVPGVAGFTASGAEYNLATGLGSVDASVMVSNWGTTTAPPPTLSLSVASSSIALAQGSTVSVSLNVAAGGTFRGAVMLSVTGLSAGLTAAWNGNPVPTQAGGGNATLTLTASAATQPVLVPLVITARGGGLTAACQVTVEVQQRVIRARGAPALPAVPRRK
jgi:hypothetical protein